MDEALWFIQNKIYFLYVKSRQRRGYPLFRDHVTMRIFRGHVFRDHVGLLSTLTWVTSTRQHDHVPSTGPRGRSHVVRATWIAQNYFRCLPTHVSPNVTTSPCFSIWRDSCLAKHGSPNPCFSPTWIKYFPFFYNLLINFQDK